MTFILLGVQFAECHLAYTAGNTPHNWAYAELSLAYTEYKRNQFSPFLSRFIGSEELC